VSIVIEMQVPDIVERIGVFNKGGYRDAVYIVYSRLPCTVAIENRLEGSSTLEALLREIRRVICKHSDANTGNIDAEGNAQCNHLKEKIRSVLTPIISNPKSAAILFERCEEIVKEHVNKLSPYGRIAFYDEDSILFSPDDEHREFLVEKNYFMDVPKPHRCSIERKFLVALVYGHRRWATLDEKGYGLIGIAVPQSDESGSREMNTLYSDFVNVTGAENPRDIVLSDL
jgi:septum formation topological specificity factor MinE